MSTLPSSDRGGLAGLWDELRMAIAIILIGWGVRWLPTTHPLGRAYFRGLRGIEDEVRATPRA